MTHEDWGHIISKEKAGMYAGILRCTISEQEGEHTVFQNQIGAFTALRLECGFKLLCAIQWVQSCVLNSVKRKALTRTHGLEPRSRNGWLKWAEYEIRPTKRLRRLLQIRPPQFRGSRQLAGQLVQSRVSLTI
jgi:hypothetical protein